MNVNFQGGENVKKLFTVLMAIALVVALSVPVFASDNDYKEDGRIIYVPDKVQTNQLYFYGEFLADTYYLRIQAVDGFYFLTGQFDLAFDDGTYMGVPCDIVNMTWYEAFPDEYTYLFEVPVIITPIVGNTPGIYLIFNINDVLVEEGGTLCELTTYLPGELLDEQIYYRLQLDVIHWVGMVVDAVMTGPLSPLLLLLAVPIAVTALVFSIKAIRKSSWGA